MNVISQKEAARQFAKKWAGKGVEREDDRTFWLELLQRVYRVEDPYPIIRFQKPVKFKTSTKAIDAYIAETRVLIEQKGADCDLSKKYVQSDGEELTPYEQARRYDQWMLPNEHPLWIVVSNFQSFEIHNMERPFDDPDVILLKDLPDQYQRMAFIADAKKAHIQREEAVCLEAGDIVGKLYDELQKQYINPSDELAMKSLNVLCVRFVFCLYAEDAGIFAKNQFHDYLKDVPVDDMREALIKLFDVLDTPVDERDPYLKPVLKAFPYTNGGLFHDRNIEIPLFTDDIKQTLLEDASTGFDWSVISPTVFGGVFESTLNPETRDEDGAHFTSVENIHKVIDPLFLDSLKAEFQNLKDLKASTSKEAKRRQEELRKFQSKLAGLRFLDPACGSGNFLTETYLSLRRLENDVLRELHDGNMILDLDYEKDVIQVKISQFYGIEINDFAADVARTALWISEAQMMEETQAILQQNMDVLPLKTNSNIRVGNALRMDWNEVIQAAEVDYLIGNPPFKGYSKQTREQKSDVLSVFVDDRGKALPFAGKIDYVGCWYRKGLEYVEGNRKIQAAFISTSSVIQGEQVAFIWRDLVENRGLRFNFAYRPFAWKNGSKNEAGVYCVIIGWSHKEAEFSDKFIFDVDGSFVSAKNINAYLLDYENIYVESVTKPLFAVPQMVNGNKPVAGKHLFLTEEERAWFIKRYPFIEKYICPFFGADEFVNGKKRYCFWLVDANPSDLANCPPLMERIEQVRVLREQSDKAATRELAATPTLFAEIRQPATTFIVIPEVSTSSRGYVPIGFMESTSIASNKIQMIPDATLYEFGVLSSSVNMAWLKTVCGRLGDGFDYSGKIVYNNFPWPSPTNEQIERIKETAQGILDARAKNPDSPLKDQYEVMLPDLMKAHRANDDAVRKAYGFPKDASELDIVIELFKRYKEKILIYNK